MTNWVVWPECPVKWIEVNGLFLVRPGYEYLFTNSAISEQQRDGLFYAHDNAKAEVQKAKAALANAELNYSYTTIKAPFDGIVGMSSSDVGTFIDEDSQNAQLTTVSALH